MISKKTKHTEILTNTINNIIPQSHALRHLPNGADALTTDAPVAIGTANFIGTANSFARSDHIHNFDPSLYNINNFSNVLSVARGGTGLSTLNSNTFLTANSTTTLVSTFNVPVGAVVGTTDVQTLSNKTLNSVNNNIAANALRNGNFLTNLGNIAPVNGQVLSYDGTNAVWASSNSSPGGMSGQLQYNNNGSFAGTNITTNGTNLVMTGNIISGSKTIGANYTTYSVGTVSQIGTTISGVGTTFTPNMIGGLLTYTTLGLTVGITAFVNSTTLTCDTNATVASQTYNLIHGRIHISPVGTTTVTNLGINYKNTANTFTTTIRGGNTSSNTLMTLPTISDTFVGTLTTDTLTNKTLVSSTNDIAANRFRHNTSFVSLSNTFPVNNQVLTYFSSSGVATWANQTQYVVPTIISTSYNMIFGDTYIISTNTTSSTSIQLIDAITAGIGYRVTIKDGGGAAGEMTTTNYNTGGSAKHIIITSTSIIDESPVRPKYVSQSYGSITFISDGSKWLTQNPYASFGKYIAYASNTQNVPQNTQTAVLFPTFSHFSGMFTNNQTFDITSNTFFRNISPRTQTWQITLNLRFAQNLIGNDITFAVILGTLTNFQSKIPFYTIASDSRNNTTSSPVVINLSVIYKIEPNYGIWIGAYHNDLQTVQFLTLQQTSGIQIIQLE